MKQNKFVLILLLLILSTAVMAGCASMDKEAFQLYYKVEFLNYDGSVFETAVVKRHMGTATPTLTSGAYLGVNADGQRYSCNYIFKGWDQDTSDVVCDMRINPVYELNGSELVYLDYIVKFVDYNGLLVDTQIVEKGGDAVAPSIEIPTGSVVIWDKNFRNIQQNIVVTAKLVKEKIDYIFDAGEGKFADGTNIKVFEDVMYTDPINVNDVEIPVLKHNDFVNWNCTIEEDGAVIRYTAEYSLCKYTVTFMVKDTVVATIPNVPYGSAIDSSLIPECPTSEMYEFLGWKGGNLDFIEGDTTFVAEIKGVPVTYIYLDINGNEYMRKQFRYEEIPADPIAPEVIGMTFIEWQYSEVTKGTDGKYYIKATPKYILGKYFKVAFIVNGTLVKAELVEQGKTPVNPLNMEGVDLSEFIPEGKKIAGWGYNCVNEETGEIEFKIFDFTKDVVNNNMTLQAILVDAE